MTLEKAKSRIAGEAEEELRLWRESRLERRQYHEGRRDGLLFAKKALARVGEDVLAGPRKELERLRRQALQSARFPIGDAERARRHAEAWAYKKALELLGGGECKEDDHGERGGGDH